MTFARCAWIRVAHGHALLAVGRRAVQSPIRPRHCGSPPSCAPACRQCALVLACQTETPLLALARFPMKTSLSLCPHVGLRINHRELDMHRAPQLPTPPPHAVLAVPRSVPRRSGHSPWKHCPPCCQRLEVVVAKRIGIKVEFGHVRDATVSHVTGLNDEVPEPRRATPGGRQVP